MTTGKWSLFGVWRLGFGISQGTLPSASGEGTTTKHNVMTFLPEGARGVAAYVDGQVAASA